MQLKTLFAAFAIAIAGCGLGDTDQSEKQNDVNTGEMTEAIDGGNGKPSGKKEQNNKNGNWEKMVMHPFYDQQGQVMAVMPFPSTWQIHRNQPKGTPTITGPDGIKVIDYPTQSYTYTNDPNMQQMYYRSGKQLRAFPGIEDVIQQDIVPWCSNQGYEFVRYYEIPEVTKINKWYNDQLYKALPTHTEVVAIGTEWKSRNGDPFFLLMHLTNHTSEYTQGWYYICTTLQAANSQFEKAKKQLIFSLANTHYPLEPIMAFNRMEAEKAGRSWAAHNQRMAQNQANFEAHQRAHVNKSNAINDAIMNGWRERNAASDRSHEQFVDVITERTNVVDPSTGQRYKVSSGSNQYWMNSNGEYIGTNSHDYNPNLDENMNNQRWEELKEVK